VTSLTNHGVEALDVFKLAIVGGAWLAQAAVAAGTMAAAVAAAAVPLGKLHMTNNSSSRNSSSLQGGADLLQPTVGARHSCWFAMHAAMGRDITNIIKGMQLFLPPFLLGLKEGAASSF
jgi:hypothetical protein